MISTSRKNEGEREPKLQTSFNANKFECNSVFVRPLLLSFYLKCLPNGRYSNELKESLLYVLVLFFTNFSRFDLRFSEKCVFKIRSVCVFSLVKHKLSKKEVALGRADFDSLQ